MTWDLAQEVLAAVFLVVLLLSIRRNYSLVTPADKIYTYCIYAVFASIVSVTTASTLVNGMFEVDTPSAWVVHTLAFIIMPLVAVVFMYYLIASMDDTVKIEIAHPRLLAIPYVVYVFFVLTNWYTHALFYIDSAGYHFGSYEFLNYGMTYLYCLVTLFLAVWYRKYFNSSARWVYMIFPVLTIFAAIVQQLAPKLLMLDSNYVVALFIIYLFLQNIRINTDPVTLLGDKNSFTNRVRAELRGGESFVVVLVMLRRWNWIREGYGRALQDDLARAIAQYLGSVVDRQQVFRRSNTQFAIFVPVEDMNKGGGVVDAIFTKFSLPWQEHGLSIVVPISIATLQHPGIISSPEEADMLLDYVGRLAKLRLPEQTIRCTDNMLETVLLKESLIHLLLSEVEMSGFSVAYQPIFTNDEKCVRFLEAYVRLPEGPFREMSPTEFVPVAQEVGIMTDIGNITLDRVCKFIRKLIDDKIYIDGISINVSLLQVSNPGWVEDTIRIITENKVPFSMIMFEFTESVFEENTAVVTDAMKKMRSLGIRFILDNFGSGHANINHLLMWDFDGIKFDQIFVQGDTDTNNSFIVMSELATAFNKSNIMTIASGIETVHQDSFAKRANCQYLQGFYFAMPVAEDEIEALLSRFADRMPQQP